MGINSIIFFRRISIDECLWILSAQLVDERLDFDAGIVIGQTSKLIAVVSILPDTEDAVVVVFNEIELRMWQSLSHISCSDMYFSSTLFFSRPSHYCPPVCLFLHEWSRSR